MKRKNKKNKRKRREGEGEEGGGEEEEKKEKEEKEPSLFSLFFPPSPILLQFSLFSPTKTYLANYHPK